MTHFHLSFSPSHFFRQWIIHQHPAKLRCADAPAMNTLFYILYLKKVVIKAGNSGDAGKAMVRRVSFGSGTMSHHAIRRAEVG